MNGQRFLAGFDVNQVALVHQNVVPSRVFSLKLFPAHNDLLLMVHPLASQFQFLGKTPFVDRFEQPGAFFFVNLDCCADHVVCHAGLFFLKSARVAVRQLESSSLQLLCLLHAV